MEFAPKRCWDPRSDALEKYLLSRLDQVDEKKISDPKLAQGIFLLKHRTELSKKVEKKLVSKLLEDIDFILTRGWGKEISKRDFFHVHLCSVSQLPIINLDLLLSEVNVRLLYHTFEVWHEMPYFANRNIKSSLLSKPEVVPITHEEFVDNHGYRTYRFSKITIHSSDLGWSEYGKIEFEENPNGCHKLKNGTTLEMRGILSLCLVHHIKMNTKTGVIELDGERIGRAKKS